MKLGWWLVTRTGRATRRSVLFSRSEFVVLSRAAHVLQQLILASKTGRGKKRKENKEKKEPQCFNGKEKLL